MYNSSRSLLWKKLSYWKIYHPLLALFTEVSNPLSVWIVLITNLNKYLYFEKRIESSSIKGLCLSVCNAHILSYNLLIFIPSHWAGPSSLNPNRATASLSILGGNGRPGGQSQLSLLPIGPPYHLALIILLLKGSTSNLKSLRLEKLALLRLYRITLNGS